VAYNFQTGNDKIIAREFLDMHFPGRWVGRDGPILNFFLWGYVKDIVYKTPVTFLVELKLRIFAMESVTPNFCILLIT
jgi:hypothetical protein